jgi:hypothetical protein
MGCPEIMGVPISRHCWMGWRWGIWVSNGHMLKCSPFIGRQDGLLWGKMDIVSGDGQCLGYTWAVMGPRIFPE